MAWAVGLSMAAKMGMSLATQGLVAEFGPQGVAINAPWPRTVIATDAINMLPGVDAAACGRPEIMADAGHAVLTRTAAGFHGQFLIEDEVLAQAGITDLSGYAVDPSRALLPDLFLDWGGGQHWRVGAIWALVDRDREGVRRTGQCSRCSAPVIDETGGGSVARSRRISASNKAGSIARRWYRRVRRASCSTLATR